ncbi:MAG: Gfo/Idh/MocA family oxidoreductase [Ekhidna sp.]
MQTIISKVKNFRKQHFLNTKNEAEFAFVGIGYHSLTNLYPILNFYRIPIKYIVTSSRKNADKISKNFPHSIGTNRLQDVLNDPDIKGVLISANPSSHLDLASEVLKAGKNVFVEKPPCQNLEELHQLIRKVEENQRTCLVGLQKRYAPANILLKKKMKAIRSYNYRFITGGYPEGNPITDLFIHPIDLCIWLFGEGKIKSLLKRRTKSQITFFLQIQHANGIIGSVELSTCGSWQHIEETLSIQTKLGLFSIKDSTDLSFIPQSNSILGMPKEKLFAASRIEQTLAARVNYSSSLYDNQLYTAGFFSEVKTFIDCCEGRTSQNESAPFTLLNTYQILDQLNNS